MEENQIKKLKILTDELNSILTDYAGASRSLTPEQVLQGRKKFHELFMTNFKLFEMKEATDIEILKMENEKNLLIKKLKQEQNFKAYSLKMELRKETKKHKCEIKRQKFENQKYIYDYRKEIVPSTKEKFLYWFKQFFNKCKKDKKI